MGRGHGCSSLEKERWQTLQSSELGNRTSTLRGAKAGDRGAADQGVRAQCRLQDTVLWCETLLRAVNTGQDGSRRDQQRENCSEK